MIMLSPNELGPVLTDKTVKRFIRSQSDNDDAITALVAEKLYRCKIETGPGKIPRGKILVCLQEFIKALKQSSLYYGQMKISHSKPKASVEFATLSFTSAEYCDFNGDDFLDITSRTFTLNRNKSDVQSVGLNISFASHCISRYITRNNEILSNQLFADIYDSLITYFPIFMAVLSVREQIKDNPMMCVPMASGLCFGGLDFYQINDDMFSDSSASVCLTRGDKRGVKQNPIRKPCNEIFYFGAKTYIDYDSMSTPKASLYMLWRKYLSEYRAEFEDAFQAYFVDIQDLTTPEPKTKGFEKMFALSTKLIPLITSPEWLTVEQNRV